MDDFIGKLIDRLKAYDEPVVLVMYGDHLPGFEITEDDITNGDLYQTEYFVWSNMKNFPVEDEDIEACFMDRDTCILMDGHMSRRI